VPWRQLAIGIINVSNRLTAPPPEPDATLSAAGHDPRPVATHMRRDIRREDRFDRDEPSDNEGPDPPEVSRAGRGTALTAVTAVTAIKTGTLLPQSRRPRWLMPSRGTRRKLAEAWRSWLSRRPRRSTGTLLQRPRRSRRPRCPSPPGRVTKAHRVTAVTCLPGLQCGERGRPVELDQSDISKSTRFRRALDLTGPDRAVT
jgi:hypothetical protein